MIVELGGGAYEGLRRATIDPSLPWKDYTLLESGSDHLECLSAAEDSPVLRAVAQRCRAHYVVHDDLKPLGSEPLRLAQKAVDTVLDSAVYADGLLNQVSVKAELAEKEWTVAAGLRELAALHARQDDPAPGREFSRGAKERLRDEGTTTASIGALVAGLESCAALVDGTDGLYDELQDRETVTGLGNQLRDLVASVSARTRQAGGTADPEQQADIVLDALRELDKRTGWLWEVSLKTRGQSAIANPGSGDPLS